MLEIESKKYVCVCLLLGLKAAPSAALTPAGGHGAVTDSLN